MVGPLRWTSDLKRKAKRVEEKDGQGRIKVYWQMIKIFWVIRGPIGGFEGYSAIIESNKNNSITELVFSDNCSFGGVTEEG